MTTASTRAIRMFAQYVREANLMATPAKETFLTGLAMHMDELADQFESEEDREFKRFEKEVDSRFEERVLGSEVL